MFSLTVYACTFTFLFVIGGAFEHSLLLIEVEWS